jgi:protein TonB
VAQPAPRPAPTPAPAPSPAAGVEQPSLIGTAPGAWCKPGNDRGWDLGRVRGPVELRIAVGADGAPTAIEITASSGYPKLDRAARDDTTFCHFRPATRGGIPVPGVVVRRFRPVQQD